MRTRPTTVAAATPIPAFHHEELSPVKLAKCFKCLKDKYNISKISPWRKVISVYTTDTNLCLLNKIQAA